MITSEYNIDDTVYVLDGTKIVQTKIRGVLEEDLRQGIDIINTLKYKIGWGWIEYYKVFATKQDAGRHLLAINGLEAGVV